METPDVLHGNEARREHRKVHAAAAVVSLLNQAEAISTGWVLAFDKDEIAKILGPLYAKLDQV